MKIFITGISGMLGSNTAFLWHKKYQIYGQCHDHPFQAAGISAVNCNLAEECPELLRALEKIRPHVVMHCAALTNVDACEKAPELARRINAESTAMLAGAASRIGAKFVYISTDAVYRDGPGKPHNEDSRVSPLNEYGRTKLAGEEAVQKNCKKHLILRTTIYGYNYQDKLSLGEWILSKLSKSESVSMFSDVLFSPLLVNDLVVALDRLLQKDLTGVFNLATKDAVTKYEFGKKIARIFDKDEELIKQISIDDFGFIAKRQKNMALDIKKVSGHISLPTVEEGIKHFFKLSRVGYADKLKKGEWS